MPGSPGVCRIEPGGASWVVHTNGLYQPPGYDKGTAVIVAADPRRTGVVYVAVESFTNNRAIHRSADSGETWTPLPKAPGSADNAHARRVKCLAADAAGTNRIFAGLFWDGLWYSEDAGTNWARAHGAGADLDYASVQHILPLSNGTVLAAFDSGLYRSADHGRTFAPVLTNAHWGEATLELGYAAAVNPANSNEMFFSTAEVYPVWPNVGSVWRSVNGGVSWSNITANLDVSNVVALACHHGDLYAATWGANVYRCTLAPLGIGGLDAQGPTKMRLRWPSVADRWYAVHTAAQVTASFQAAAVHLPAAPPENVYTDSVAGVTSRFYRIAAEPTPAPPRAVLANTNKPGQTLRLFFIHHSTGENWLRDDYGRLGIALSNNNYFVSDSNYGWGPDTIGDTTDIGHWYNWFRGPDSAAYLAAAYAESDRHCEYSRRAPPAAGPNRIVMFKSCFPNSNLQGDPAEPVPLLGQNPLRGQDSSSDSHTVANAKAIYMDLLNCFAAHRDTLFVAVAAPPLQDATWADNARAFNEWLVNDWLDDYPHANVFVFDFYNVLTSNNGSPDDSDEGLAAGNHHRWWQGAVQHKTDGGANVAAYPSGDDHPNEVGSQKATAEFVPLLNAAVNAWLASP
jgi:hypothetical protein